jgi:alpha-methylacyl-CoA racemase
MTQPLTGLKVLDLSMNLPGPYMTWLLTLLGAEVLKVENPAGGDYGRTLGPTTQESPFFAPLNRNKRSIKLNLKHAEGRKIFMDLLDKYDVLVEGFRPGAMDKLGLGQKETRERNPRLIYVSITGYGHDNEFRLRAGHDVNYLSLSGVLSMTGDRSGQPCIPGVQIADFVGGSMLGMIGLLAAIIHREKTGEGQFVDTAMFDGALAAASMVFGGVRAGMEDPRPAGMLLNGKYPCYNVYKTKDGRHMALGAIEAKFWRNFCAAVGRDDLLDHQYGGEYGISEVQKIFQERDFAEWTQFFTTVDACCDPVLTLPEAAESQLVKARSMIAKSNGKTFLGSPLKLSACPPPQETPAPALGEHTNDVLTDLGISPSEIQRLASEGVI